MRAKTAITILFLILAMDAVVYLGATMFGMPFLALFIAVMSVAAAAFLVTTAYAAFRGAPFVPTDYRNVDEMLRIASVGPGMRVMDLGSGDGRILIAAAKAGAVAEGWEVNPWLWLISLWNARRAGVADKVRVHLGSYWHDVMRDADAVFLFCIDLQMRAMERKLRDELRSGAKVVSYAFRFPDWEHVDTNGKGVYLYLKT